jgi:hypothetical protein
LDLTAERRSVTGTVRRPRRHVIVPVAGACLVRDRGSQRLGGIAARQARLAAVHGVESARIAAASAEPVHG